MIGYVMVGTNDLERATGFYDALLREVGVGRLFPTPNGQAYGPAPGQPMLAVTKPYDGQPATAGNGTMVALSLDSRAQVDTVHARALALGGSDEGAPGLRGPEGPQAFYGAYFRDLDGNKLCVFRFGAA